MVFKLLGVLIENKNIFKDFLALKKNFQCKSLFSKPNQNSVPAFPHNLWSIFSSAHSSSENAGKFTCNCWLSEKCSGPRVAIGISVRTRGLYLKTWVFSWKQAKALNFIFFITGFTKIFKNYLNSFRKYWFECEVHQTEISFPWYSTFKLKQCGAMQYNAYSIHSWTDRVWTNLRNSILVWPVLLHTGMITDHGSVRSNWAQQVYSLPSTRKITLWICERTADEFVL
jgi:hypothetical protein